MDCKQCGGPGCAECMAKAQERIEELERELSKYQRWDAYSAQGPDVDRLKGIIGGLDYLITQSRIERAYDLRLVEYAARNAGRIASNLAPRWSHVVEAFGVGSTSACEICRRFELDPDEVIGGNPCERCEP